MKRNSIIRSCALAGLVAASLIGGALDAFGADTAGKPYEGVNLRVGTYGGPWTDFQKEKLAPKMEAMGATVTFIAGSPQINLAKLIAARGGSMPIDVIEIDDGLVGSMTTGKFLQPLDLSLIPNAQFLPKREVKPLMVAIWSTQEGICYNEAKYKELGLAPPKTYADLGNSKLQGRVLIPDIVSGGGLPAVAGFAYASGGNVDNIEPGLEAISKLKSIGFWKSGTEALNRFKSGDIYAAAIHAGWCVRGARAGMPLMMAYPVVNATTVGGLKVGWIGTVAGMDKKTAAAANAYVNLYLDTDYQREFALKLGVVPANQVSIQGLSSDPLLARQLILDAKKIDQMLHIDYTKVNVSDWYDQWNRTVNKAR
jgi:putative spermidine/putrescine transport system substrate-binding protein